MPSYLNSLRSKIVLAVMTLLIAVLFYVADQILVDLPQAIRLVLIVVLTLVTFLISSAYRIHQIKYYLVFILIIGTLVLNLSQDTFLSTWFLGLLLLVLFQIYLLFFDYIDRKIINLNNFKASKLPETIFILVSQAKSLKSGIKTIKSEDINVDDQLLIKPGQVIPLDCLVLEGSSSLDESLITGNNIFIDKGVGDLVWAGSKNIHGTLIVKVLAKKNNSLLVGIENYRLGLSSTIEQGSILLLKTSDQVSGILKLAMFFLSLTLTIYFYSVKDLSSSNAIYLFLALLLSFDFRNLQSLLSYNFYNFLIKTFKERIFLVNLDQIDKISQASVIIFNKTGILSQRNPRVLEVISFKDQSPESKNEVLQKAASLEVSDSHILANSIIKKTQENDISLLDARKHLVIPGLGVTGYIESNRYLVGSILLAKKFKIALPTSVKKVIEQKNKEGKTVVILANITKGNIEGLVILSDMLKVSTPKIIDHLKKHFKIYLVSSDSHQSTLTLASECGIETERVHGELTPDDKVALINSFQNQGERLIFIGDKKNDDLALNQAGIGVALGVEKNFQPSPFIQIMEGDLAKVSQLISLAHSLTQDYRRTLILTTIQTLALILIISLSIDSISFLYLPCLALLFLISYNFISLGRVLKAQN